MEEINGTTSESQARRPKWVTAKLILGIISMVLFGLVAFQSCAAGLGNIMSNNGEASGTFGFVVALNLLFSGIIAVAARKSTSKIPWIICTILLWINLLFSRAFNGSYGDLVIWGFISFLFGAFYLLSSVRSVTGHIVVIVIAALVFLIAKLFGSTTEEDVKVNEASIPSFATIIETDGQSLKNRYTSNHV